MTIALLVIIVVALSAVVLAYLIAGSKGFARGYAKGYAAGQYAESRAIARALSDMRQRSLAAERDIDYLYERARWQIARIDPGMARLKDGSHE
jgi:hypothetical protein